MRFENTWQEIRDHFFIQNHSRSFRFTDPWRCFFSSLTHLLQGSGQRTGMAKQKLAFVLSDPFLCCFWGLCLDYCPVGRSKHGHYKISNRVSNLLILYLLVFDRIHDAMCLNDVQDLQQKYRHNIKTTAVYFIVHRGTCYPCVHQTHLECLLIKS